MKIVEATDGTDYLGTWLSGEVTGATTYTLKVNANILGSHSVKVRFTVGETIYDTGSFTVIVVCNTNAITAFTPDANPTYTKTIPSSPAASREVVFLIATYFTPPSQVAVCPNTFELYTQYLGLGWVANTDPEILLNANGDLEVDVNALY